ncbi:uncharacterized protein LOC128998567 [Macrosteles quadrilineatus]|uniref:uncharacterized protein LOC128998567 n=1 Tax=Macrosteles quadrilineatus TaxID=74068 RepID=UPI0023E1ADC5|nr:uncharacterized protein LOC128998567 [Macrosteles quadrilineatus]
MRPGFLNTCLASLYFLIASAASPRDKYRDAAEHLPEVVKSVTQDLSKEPSCDELRAMWRFSKRQSRAAESTNEIPTYRDPFAYNVWEDHASIRSVGGGKMRRPLVYGRLVHNGYQRPRVQEAPVPERIRGFEDFARMFNAGHMPKAHTRRKPTTIRLVGGNSLGQMQIDDAQPTSFQKLKQMIQLERARELHEQKLSEESAARESALQYQRMMIQDASAGATGLVPYSHGHRRPQLDPVVNFPDVLAPSNDYYTNYNNYMQRSSYPEPLSRLTAPGRSLIPVANPQFLNTEIELYSSPRTVRSSQQQPSPSSISSFIDEEISRLVKKSTPFKTIDMVLSFKKRGSFNLPLQEYTEDDPDPVIRDLPPLIFSLLPSYPIDQQEMAWIEDGTYEPVDTFFVETEGDPKLTPELDAPIKNKAEEVDGDYKSDVEGCPDCLKEFVKAMGYIMDPNDSEARETFFTENTTLDGVDLSNDQVEPVYQDDRETMLASKPEISNPMTFERDVGKQQSLTQNSNDDINGSSTMNMKDELKERKEVVSLQEKTENPTSSSRSNEIKNSDLRSHDVRVMDEYGLPLRKQKTDLKKITPRKPAEIEKSEPPTSTTYLMK